MSNNWFSRVTNLNKKAWSIGLGILAALGVVVVLAGVICYFSFRVGRILGYAEGLQAGLQTTSATTAKSKPRRQSQGGKPSTRPMAPASLPPLSASPKDLEGQMVELEGMLNKLTPHISSPNLALSASLLASIATTNDSSNAAVQKYLQKVKLSH